ncbi:MAG: hypothetical protein QXM65_05265 [Candidatus Bathyarchaeia archaeon]
MTYTQLVNFGKDEFTCKVEKTSTKSKNWSRQSLNMYTDHDGLKVFRKRK